MKVAFQLFVLTIQLSYYYYYYYLILFFFLSLYFLLVSSILYRCIKIEKYIILPVSLKFLPVWRCYLLGLFISMI